MLKYLYVFLASSAVVAAPAAAAGQPAGASFAGPRVEVRGGWDRTTLNASYDDGVDSFAGKGHKSGLDLGGEIGYDTPLSPSLLAGVYGGIELADTKKCSEVFGNDRACLKLGRNLTAGIRLGAKIAPKAMFYVKGGYSNGQLKATYTNADDPTQDFSAHSNRDGFHLGIGGEAAVGQHAYVRVEYVRTEYSGYTYSDPAFDVTLDGHRDQVLAGFGLRF